MRADGLLGDPTAVAHGDHVCWVYADAEEFADVARRYVAEGLARGERLLWIGEADPATVAAASGLLDLGGLLARGALQVLDVRSGYESSGAFTPGDQLAFYDAATRQALDDGFTGLRVVADVSPIAGDPQRRPDLVRWEHLADEFIGSRSGMVALCAYSGRLDPEALADVASVHPLVHAPDGCPPFRVWFDGDTLAAAGTLDTFGADRLEQVLTGTHVDLPVVTLDLTRVDFVDVGGCRTLARWARRLQDRGARLELTGTSRIFRRMWRILGFDEYADVAFREPPG